MLRTHLTIAAFTVFVMLAAGCSSTTMSGSWKNPDYSGKVKRIYLVGIAKEELVRRMFEDQFAHILQEHGTTGLPSYRDLPLDEENGEGAIISEVHKNGADSVLLARAIGKRNEKVVNPGRVSSYDYGPGPYYPAPYYRDYGSYYRRSHEYVYEPATVTEFEIITIEANLYDAASQSLVWSAQLETVVENNMNKLIKDFVKTVTKDLEKKGLI